MTQYWSINYIYQVCELKLLFRTCLKFWAIFILIGSYFQLLLNIFYHRSTAIVFGTVFFLFFFFFIVEFFVFWRKYSQSLLIFIIISIYPKTNSFHNSGVVGNFLSIGFQHTIWFKWPDFGLKCLVTITAKG